MTVETNSIGAPVIDALYSRGLPIIPFTTTSATKQTAITGLQSAFEHGEKRSVVGAAVQTALPRFEDCASDDESVCEAEFPHKSLYHAGS